MVRTGGRDGCFPGCQSFRSGTSGCRWQTMWIRIARLGYPATDRAIGLIREADKRYGQINWEYESKETAIHIAESLLKYRQDLDKFEYPGGKERLYRSVEYNARCGDKPLLDAFPRRSGTRLTSMG